MPGLISQLVSQYCFWRAVYRRKGSIPGFSLPVNKQFFSRCYALDWWACSLKGDLECAGRGATRGQGRKWWGASAQESREGWQTRELLYLLYLVVVFVIILPFPMLS